MVSSRRGTAVPAFPPPDSPLCRLPLCILYPLVIPFDYSACARPGVVTPVVTAACRCLSRHSRRRRRIGGRELLQHRGLCTCASSQTTSLAIGRIGRIGRIRLRWDCNTQSALHVRQLSNPLKNSQSQRHCNTEYSARATIYHAP